MAKKDKEVENFIEDMEYISPSKVDRETAYALMRNDLIDFMRTFMSKINEESELKRKVEEEIVNRIENEADNLTFMSLLRLLEILYKHKNEGAIGLLSILKESQKIIINNENEKGALLDYTDSNGKNDISAEDVQFVKDLRKLAKKLDKVEKSEDEQEDETELF